MHPVRPTLLAMTLAAHAATAQTIAPDPTFLRDSAVTKQYSLGRPQRIKVLPDGSGVLFLRSPPRDPTLSLFEFVTATGETRELISPAELLKGAEEQLSVAERARRERQRIQTRGFTTYDLSPDGGTVIVILSGKLYAVERASRKVRVLYGSDVPVIDPQLSPDGKSVAYVKDNDLFVTDVKSGKEKRVTTGGTELVTHGLAEFVAQEEMDRSRGFWWSPDSTSLVFEEADHRGVERFTIADPSHPEATPESFPYPRPGKQNVKVRLGLVKASGGKVTWIDWNSVGFEYVARVIWKEAKAPLTLAVQDRAQHRLRLVTVDVNAKGKKAGQVELLHEWRDDAWINLDPSLPAWLPDGSGLLMPMELGDGRSLVFVGKDGAMRELVPGDWQFQKVVHHDEKTGELKVIVAPSPVKMQLARASLKGGPVTLVTEEPTPIFHDVIYSKDGSLFVDTRTTAAELPLSTVRRSNGLAVGTLPDVSEMPKFTANLQLTTVDAKGLTFHAAIVRPRAFTPNTKYPVILYVYGGPHANVVNPDQRGSLLHQWMADHGAIVVAIDNRGTPRRGRTWEAAIDKNLADVPLNDQVDALQALAQKFPELDLARVGIYGWSFGGYLAALATERRPDIFKVGVAGAPVVDWRDYDTHYTERYLHTPEDNKAGYDTSSLLTYADKLERPLLLIHGTGDDNVYFFHTLKLADALFKAGKPFEFLPLSGTHMVADPAVRERVYERITSFLMERLK